MTILQGATSSSSGSHRGRGHLHHAMHIASSRSGAQRVVATLLPANSHALTNGEITDSLQQRGNNADGTHHASPCESYRFENQLPDWPGGRTYSDSFRLLKSNICKHGNLYGQTLSNWRKARRTSRIVAPRLCLMCSGSYSPVFTWNAQKTTNHMRIQETRATTRLTGRAKLCVPRTGRLQTRIHCTEGGGVAATHYTTQASTTGCKRAGMTHRLARQPTEVAFSIVLAKIALWMSPHAGLPIRSN